MKFPMKNFVDKNGNADDITLEKDTVSGKTFLVIPDSLWDNTHVNIKIDPSLKGNIVHKDGKIFVPHNIPVRASAMPQRDGIEYTLNLGGHTDHPDGLHLLRGRDSELTKTGRWADDVSKIIAPEIKTQGESLNQAKVNSALTSALEALKNAGGSMPPDLKITLLD